MRIINNVNWEHKLDKWKLTINDLDLSKPIIQVNVDLLKAIYQIIIK